MRTMDVEDIGTVVRFTGGPLGTVWRGNMSYDVLVYSYCIPASAVVIVIGAEKGPALTVTAAISHV